MYPAGIHAGHKTGPARRADRTLAVGAREGGSFAYEGIYCGRLDIRIAQGTDGVKPLLICAIPKYVGACGHEINHIHVVFG